MFVRPQDRHAFKADRDLGCQIINVMFRKETARHLVDRYSETIRDRYFDAKEPLPEIHDLGPVRIERAVTVSQQLKMAHGPWRGSRSSC